jgi:hypothetical protein
MDYQFIKTTVGALLAAPSAREYIENHQKAL